MLNMACTLFRLTPEEALRGMTVNAARALDLRDRGTLAAGRRADFVAWNVEHPNELAYWFGHNPAPASSPAARDGRAAVSEPSSACTAARRRCW
jgi:imidazolonepropionase